MEIDAKSLDRLSKVCGLLSSDNPSERAAAALQATKILKARNIEWPQFVLSFSAPKPATGTWFTFDGQKPAYHTHTSVKDAEGKHVEYSRELLDDYDEQLSSWERGFLENLIGKYRFLDASEKQWRSLYKIRTRLGLEE